MLFQLVVFHSTSLLGLMSLTIGEEMRIICSSDASSAHALGIYSRAYTLMLMPLSQITNVVTGVMTPALSTIQEDTARLRRSYLKAISIVGLVTFPMMTGFFLTGDHVVPP